MRKPMSDLDRQQREALASVKRIGSAPNPDALRSSELVALLEAKRRQQEGAR